jgi:hypothetical protein
VPGAHQSKKLKYVVDYVSPCELGRVNKIGVAAGYSRYLGPSAKQKTKNKKISPLPGFFGAGRRVLPGLRFKVHIISLTINQIIKMELFK